jgi:DNA-binding MarR family transcriptional regulator
MSQKEIGEAFGISTGLVRRRLRECGIEVQDKRELPIGCSELRTMYEDGKMSVGAIAEELGVAFSLVSSTLEDCGIRKRTPSEATKLTAKSFYIDPALLKQLYEDDKISTTEIARLFGIDQSTVWRKLDEIGVKTRSTSSELGRRSYRSFRSIDGDLMVYMPEHERSNRQGYITLKALAYERFHGELPPKGDRIHIVDGNVDNLSRNNLRAMTNSEHSKFHCFANSRATGNAFKTCPKDQLARYMQEWDEENSNENVD